MNEFFLIGFLTNKICARVVHQPTAECNLTVKAIWLRLVSMIQFFHLHKDWVRLHLNDIDQPQVNMNRGGWYFLYSLVRNMLTVHRIQYVSVLNTNNKQKSFKNIFDAIQME